MGDAFGAIIGGISDIGKTTAAAVLSKAQMKWQEKMRASAHQTEVKDLIKAGLNPVLSATGGAGAPMPGPVDFQAAADAMPSGGDVAKMIESLVSSAKERKQMDFERETAANIAAKSRADADRARIEADIAPFMLQAQRDNIDSDTHRNFFSSALMQSQKMQSNAQTGLLGIQTQLQRAGVPRAHFREKLASDVYKFGGSLFDWVKSQVPGALDELKSNAKEGF